MKRSLMVMVAAVSMSLGTVAFAEEAAGKPDCGDKKTAFDEAKTAAKTAGKADLSSCKDMKGKAKAECAKPLKDKAKEDGKAAKDKVKEAKMALDCCKNPKKKGCTP